MHHVAQGAGAVVKPRTAAHTHAFSHGDLHTFDERAAPQRLENGVAKAQHHEVLHGFLAQVVVNAEDLVLGKVFAHFLVDLTGRGQVVPQRLFKHHAGMWVDQVIGCQVRTDGGEQTRRGGQVVHASGAGLQGLTQGSEISAMRGIERQVTQARHKERPSLRCAVCRVNERGYLFLNEGAERGVVPSLATQHMDARGPGQVAVGMRHEQCGQQFAQRQITHAAEDDHVQGSV